MKYVHTNPNTMGAIAARLADNINS